MFDPQRAQCLIGQIGQGDEPIFMALATADMHLFAFSVDIADLQGQGLTEAQAREIYGAGQVEITEYNLAGNAKSQMLQTAGFIKLVREKDGPIVGVHMLGARVGDTSAKAR